MRKRGYLKVKIRWCASLSGMWYEDMEGQTFYVLKNPTTNYYTLPLQKKIIFKIDTV